MFREARQFSLDLQRMERDTRTLKAAMERYFTMACESMAMPLPQVYPTNDAVGAPSDQIPRIGGVTHLADLTAVSGKSEFVYRAS